VLLLDEPTANLDLGHQLDVIAAAKCRADRGAAVVAILHDLNLAALLATRLVVLSRGPIDSDGPADQVITDPMRARLRCGGRGRAHSGGEDAVRPSSRRARASAGDALKSTRGCTLDACRRLHESRADDGSNAVTGFLFVVEP
jgi:iron complex transport system ATP-binding protein